MHKLCALQFNYNTQKQFYMHLERVFSKLPHFANLGVGQIVTATDHLSFNLEVFWAHQNVS